MPSIINATTTNGVAVQGDNSGSLQLQTNNGTTAVTIDTSQNVGIGVTSPTGKIAIDATNSNTPRIVFKNPSASGDGAISTFVSSTGTDVVVGSNAYINSAGNFARFDSAQAGSYVYANRTGLLLFGTNDTSGVATERMRITSDGYFLVGCTSVPSSSVAGVALSPSVVSVAPHRFSTGSGTGVVTVMTFANGNGVIGAINTSGSNTVYATSSDYRLKENIAPMTGALGKIQQLKPCTYTWKSDGSNGEGFIAHELAEVFPDAVVGKKDAVDADGEIKAQSIDTSFLVATLTAAIQEQQAMIEELKVEVQALKGVA